MPKIKIYLSFLMLVIITGCTHSVQMAPDLSTIRSESTIKSTTNVGYYISSADLNAEVVSPGGGGDDISYFPYKDTESALKTILSQKFNKVYGLKSKDNNPVIESKNIKFIFSPKIKTDSSSESAFTWPPTDFTVVLTCIAYSANGEQIWKETVTGKGHAEYDEFTNDFSLSAKRASQQAFILMRDKILSAHILK
ncbi:hypothetical protein MNBD_GAMMA11-2816 [hydrothermal vent metagenome]|uniref:Lipoprotein n=1 Tax=hydrothermal vent metagenome TaxID=652676 RepID=A0A3B0X152_9ZZZZ